MIEVQLEFRGYKEAQKDLERGIGLAIRDAMRESLNATAFEARRTWGKEIESRLTVRNKYTSRIALRVEKAKGRATFAMFSKVGSIADFMHKQEKGGPTKGPIPGPAAAGQKSGGMRTKPVRKVNRLSALMATRGKGKTQQQRNAMAIAMAKRTGKKYAVLERDKGGMGVFRILGGKRSAKTRLMWVVGRGSSRIKPTPTLEPTIRIVEPRYQRFAADALAHQLRKHRIGR